MEAHPNAENVVAQAAAVSKSVRLGADVIDILRDVDLRVAASSTVAITGPSGSGKTTLLALLAGLDRPTSGSITLLGRVLDDLDEDRRAQLRRGRVGFVFQSFHLLPNLTALENVALALEVIPGSGSIVERSRRALERVGLIDRRAHLPSQLSGGEQQRVALARAMVVEPRILFADEPTGNLDHGTSGQVADLLFSLCVDAGATLVLVTHDRDVAARCARRHRLAAGRLDDAV